jgi:hypothetical protein
MSQVEKNKAVVLEAFDTLFNKRDYAAAERFWSSHWNGDVMQNQKVLRWWNTGFQK